MSGMQTLAANPVGHVIDHPFIVLENGWVLWSSNMTNMLVATLLVLAGGFYAASRVRTGAEGEGNDRYLAKDRFAQLIEVFFLYLREKVIRPLLHERTEKFTPYLLTLFFWILANNLLGLIPLLDIHNLTFTELAAAHRAWIGGTATQNLWVTGALALIAGIVINIAGIRALGFKEYMNHMTGGAPVMAWPLLIPIEIMGFLVIKPVALAIRLFANMTAGHILLAVLLSFPAMALGASYLIGVPVTIISVAGAVAIMFLELFVAFLQAFVFMFLTAVFLSQLAPHGDHAHDHEHAGVTGAHDGHHHPHAALAH